MGHKRFNINGTAYNEEDPLGVLKHEKDVEEASAPNPITNFIESEARKRDVARKFNIVKPSFVELMSELQSIYKKLVGMVVTTESKGKYVKGRITTLGNNILTIKIRGNKKDLWIGFSEVIKLRNNYD